MTKERAILPTKLVATNHGMVRMYEEDFDEYVQELEEISRLSGMMFVMRVRVGIIDHDPEWTKQPPSVLLCKRRHYDTDRNS